MHLPEPTRDSVLQAVRSAAVNNQDLVLAGTKATPMVNSKGQLKFSLHGEAEPASMRGSAESQYLTRVDVNVGFFHKCSPSLKQAIVSEFHQIGKSYMFRTKNSGHGTDIIRAVLGPKFPTECDDVHLFPVVLEALLAQENVELSCFTRDDDITELHARFLDTFVSMDGQTLRGSIAISNSETGHSAIWIEPTIQCFGDISISNKHGEGISRFIHRGSVPTVQEITDAITEAKRVAQIGITQYLEEANKTITIKQASKYMEDMIILPSRFSNIIENEIKDMEFIQKQDLMRRILVATKDLPLMQALNIRREVGDFVGVFRNTGSRMANLMQYVETT